MSIDKRFNINSFIVGKEKAFSQANIKELKDKSTNVYTITAGYKHRLDLISETIYGTPHLKWLLIYVNNIVDLSILDAGYEIKYPSFSDYLAILARTLEVSK